MNYITSCPKCDTQFILKKEHIKSYRGKVQCGSCEHVFNAKNRLAEISDDIHNEEAYLASLKEDTVTKETNQTAYIGNIPPINTVEKTPTTDQDYYVAEPVFLQKKEANNPWLSLLSVLLLITAILQAIYYMRTKIAAEYPQFKPVLVQACAQLNCKIDLPRNLNFITISDSDMQESDEYESIVNFSSIIINNAKYTQAYPIIKLTLTNADDAAVIEKLIRPAVYLIAKTAIKSGFTSGKELDIKIAIQIKEASVAGYRVQLIY